MQERIQKILSARGVCSRRKAEEYITQGLVTVNGKVAKLGQKADPAKDRIEVDGKVIEERKEMLYYLMNKSVGVVTENIESVKPKGKSAGKKKSSTADLQPTVRDLLPKKLQGKIFPVGRLDKDTSGLLLFTNDGVLAYRLTHPKFYHEKEYEVKVEKPIPDGAIKKLESGLKILGTKTKPTVVKRLTGRTFSIALTEGKNRQIRRMCQKVGQPVKALKRIRIVTLKDAKLVEGKVRSLTPSEKKQLLNAVGL